jgi:hypothetical protein
MLSVWRLCSVDDAMINECETVYGMKNGGGNRSTPRGPTPMSVCPPKLSHDRTSGGKPASNRLSYGKPATNHLSYGKPAINRLSYGKPASNRLSYGKPANSRLNYGKPMTKRLSYRTSTTKRLSYGMAWLQITRCMCSASPLVL